MEEYLENFLSDALNCPVAWGFFKDGEAMPRVTLSWMSDRRQYFLASKGPMRGTVQIDCWGRSFAEAVGLSRTVNTTLEQHQGGPIISAFRSGKRNGAANAKGEADRVSLSYAMTYRE